MVFEVSSFQLERAPSFKPRVSVLLNVSEDHLDRYKDFDDYAQTKGNAFVNKDASDVAVVPANDELCLSLARRGGGRICTFGSGGDFYVEGTQRYRSERAPRPTPWRMWTCMVGTIWIMPPPQLPQCAV